MSENISLNSILTAIIISQSNGDALEISTRGMDGAYYYSGHQETESVVLGISSGETIAEVVNRAVRVFEACCHRANNNAYRHRTGTAELVVLNQATGELYIVKSHKGEHADRLKAMPWQ